MDGDPETRGRMGPPSPMLNYSALRLAFKRALDAATQWAMIAIAIAGGAISGDNTYAAEPDHGIWDPFYYKNPPSSSVGSQSTQPQGSRGYGLWGPLYWTNPASKTASAGTPSNPGVASAGHREILDPFYYTNPRKTESAPQVQVASENRSHGLLGPLYYTDSPVRREPPSNLDIDFEAPHREPLTVAQMEEVIPPPSNREDQGVMPIPAVEVPAPPPNLPREGSNSLSGAESIGEEPTDNSLQFLRTSTVLLEPGQMQIDVGLAYAFTDNDFPVVDSGTDQIVEGRFKQRQLIVPFEIRLGVTRRTQFFLNTPVGWSNTEFSAVGYDEYENDGGLGDITAGFSFLLFEGSSADSSDVIFTFAATLPTGGDPFGASITALGGPSLGDGFWALSADILVIDTYDPVVVFYGIGTRQRFEREYFGVDVQPGGEYRVQLGVGFAVNPQVTLSTRFLAAYFSDMYLDDERFPGSIQEPISLRFAATILRDCVIVEPFATIGATDDAADAEFGIVWTY